MAGLNFDRALFRAYESSLWPFTPEAAAAAGGSRRCSPHRVCISVQASLLTASLALFAITASLHSGHVGVGGCLGAQLEAATSYWAGGPGGNGSTPATFFRPDDILRVQLDWDGITGGRGSIVYDDGSGGSGGSGVSGGSGSGAGVRVPWPPGGNPLAAFSPDYVFAFTPALVALDAYAMGTGSVNDPSQSLSRGAVGGSMAAAHGFRRFNVTLPATACAALGGGALGSGADFMLGYLVSYDTVMVNALMWTFPDVATGYVRNTATGEDWGWSRPRGMLTGALGAMEGSAGAGITFLWRLSAALELFLAYFFVSGISALLVRTLLTSGVAVMYAFAAAMRRMLPASEGLRNSDRVLNGAYPWIGAHMRQLRLQGESAGPLLWSHAQTMAVVFAMHACAQVTLSAVLFNWKSVPGELGTLMWGVFLGLEYVTLVYARTRAGILLIARGVALLWAAWGTYFYAVPYGFFAEATAIFALLAATLIIATVHRYEVPALVAGRISYEKPRELLVRLAALEVVGGSPGALPPLWSLFHQLNFAPADLYDQPVPPLNVVVPGAGPEGEGGGGAAAAPRGLAGAAVAAAAEGGGYVAAEELEAGGGGGGGGPRRGGAGAHPAAAPAGMAGGGSSEEEGGSGGGGGGAAGAAAEARGAVPLLRETFMEENAGALAGGGRPPRRY
jgi:hypothetical protein